MEIGYINIVLTTKAAPMKHPFILLMYFNRYFPVKNAPIIKNTAKMAMTNPT